MAFSYTKVRYLAVYVGTEKLWPFLILVEVGPALVSLLILPLLPETPRYLLLVTQNRDAARKGRSTRLSVTESASVKSECRGAASML